MAGKAWIYRYLDPADALGEVLFGLIMALTLSTSGRLLMISGGFETREFVAAVLGCNVAWGVIDGVLFVLGGAFDRGRRAHFFRVLRQVKDETQAIAAIRDEFSLEEAPLTVGNEDRAALYRAILTLATHATPRAVRLTRDDVIAALIVCLLVSVTAIPAVAPFLLIHDQSVALRVSNALSIGLLLGPLHRSEAVGRWRGGHGARRRARGRRARTRRLTGGAEKKRDQCVRAKAELRSPPCPRPTRHCGFSRPGIRRRRSR